MTPYERGMPRLGWMPLFAILGVLALGFQGTRGLWEPDEGRYVEVAREMILSGNYVVPTLNQVPHFTKPPLTYWAIAAGIRTIGWNEWGARLYLAFALVGTAWLTAWLGERLWGAPAGRWAGLVYATMPLPFIGASVITTDALLVLWETAALACFWSGQGTSRAATARLWMIGFWGCLGLAFLTKGPPGLLPLLVVTGFFALVRRRSDDLGWRTWVDPFGLGLFLLVAVPWFVVVVASHDGLGPYWVWKEGLARVFSGEHRRNSRWYMAVVVYIPTLLLGAFPWWLTVRTRVDRLDLRAAIGWLRADARRLFLALWVVVPLGVLSLASSRLPFYLLPVFPAIALAIAGARGRQVAAFPPSWVPVGLWIVVLLGLRLVSAGHSTTSDTRATAGWIAPHLGAGPVEVVVIDLPVYGLAFYLGVPVEVITSRQRGAPEYWLPESWATELAELPTTPRRHLFLVRRQTRDALIRALGSVPASCREVASRRRHHLIACDPGSGPPPPRLALWLETSDTAGGRFRAIDELRELDEWHGLDRLVVLRYPPPVLPLRRLLDGYQAWPLESRGVPVDIVEPGMRRGRRAAGTASASRIVGTPGPTPGEMVYGVPERPDRNTLTPPWRVRLHLRCGRQDATAGGFEHGDSARAELPAAMEATLALCRDTAGPELHLALVVRGVARPPETLETIGLSPEQLRGRILVFEFRPERLDIVLTTPDYRDVVPIHPIASP